MTTEERVMFLEGAINRIKKDQELLEKSVEGLWDWIKNQQKVNEQVLKILGGDDAETDSSG